MGGGGRGSCLLDRGSGGSLLKRCGGGFWGGKGRLWVSGGK